MKPVYLEIEGLNSFEEKQSIDFSLLCEKGIFGIFGPTGSGKSTILDGITLALYGNISRGSNEFINTNKNYAHVKYIFETGVGNKKNRYIVERIFKNKKSTKNAQHYKSLLIDENNEVLADKKTEVDEKITSLFGLTKDDFTRSVVIPQGKFSEFIRLKNVEKRKMLERIFNLERFGLKLNEEVKKYRNKLNAEIDIINAQMTQYNQASEEKVYEYKKQIIELKKEKKFLQDLYIDYQEQKNIIGNITENIKKSNLLENQIHKLKENSEFLNNRYVKSKKELELLEYKTEECSSIYNEQIPKLSKKHANLEIAIKKNDDLKIVKKEINLLKYKKQELKKLLEIKNNKYNDKVKLIDKNKEEIEKNNYEIEKLSIKPDLRKMIVEGYDIEKRLKENIALKEKYVQLMEEFNKNILRIKKEIESNNAFLNNKNLELDKLSDEIIVINKYIKDNDYFFSELEKINEKKSVFNELKSNELKRNEIEDKITELNENILELRIEINELESEHINIRTEFIENQEKIERFKIKNITIEIAQELEDGKPCPVCGSKEHPQIAVNNYIGYKDEKLENDIKITEKKLKEIEIEIAKKNQILIQYKINKNELKNDLKSVNSNIFGGCDELEKEIFLLEENYKKEKKEVEKYKIEVFKINTKQEEVKDEIVNLSIKDKTLYKDIEHNEIKISESKNIIKSIDENISNYKNDLNIFKNKTGIIEFENQYFILNEWDKKLESLESYKKQLEEKLEKDNKKISKLQEQIQTMKQNQISFDIRINNNDSKINNLAKEIEIICGKDEPVILFDEVKGKIDKITIDYNDSKKQLNLVRNDYKEIEIEKVKCEQLKDKSIEEYKEIENIIQKQIQSIKVERNLTSDFATKKIFSTKTFEIDMRVNVEKDKIDQLNNDIIDKISKTGMKIDENNIQIGRTITKVSELEEGLKKIKSFIEQKKKVEKEKDIINKIYTLVRGGSFVEFAAYKYLKYISLEASERLKFITSGRYALEIDDDSSFVIRDDFNGGIRRHCNTLSGGEVFLVSLALALSLSSHIQLKGNVPLEFFFLDEGFGTLDDKTLEQVIESLEKLNQERLTVGVISHVDKLKERMPVKLIVEPAKAGIAGAKVKINYS